MKVKSSWDIDGRTAKRRKKSLDLKKAKTQLERMREVSSRCAPPEPFACGIEHCSVHYAPEGGESVLGGRSLSVIEMVAFLEQRASALLVDCAKPCAPACAARLSAQPRAAPGGAEPFPGGAGEPCAQRAACGGEQQQGEPVRVLDMVARLESECLKRQGEREAGGSLSRNNSFRRSVGRLLLASGTQPEGEAGKGSPGAPGGGSEEAGGAEAGHGGRCGPLGDSEPWDGAAPARQPFASGLDPRVGDVSAGLAHAVLAITAGRSDPETHLEPPRALPPACPAAARLPPAASQSKSAAAECASKEPVLLPKQGLHPARKEPFCISIAVTKSEKGCRQEKLSGSSEEPLPGRLFFLQADQPAPLDPQLLRGGTQGKPGKAAQSEDEDAWAADGACASGAVPAEPPARAVPAAEGAAAALDASCLKRQVSHGFLETRFKIQQLLEPQQYMAFLPHHIIVKIFALLPTRSLVALKCTCYYFKFIIEYYNIRPADSRWVRDPRYREDPCKQCKKKYVKGDVSLCRWHPKPYCQALPYGPGYWMCCHRSQKGIPGCKLGLHDNHWVPACHSFNRALHKKSRGAGADAEEEY